MGRETYFVETWGCQMNVLDSQVLEGILRSRGLRVAEAPESADVVLLNTCAVREKSVQKVLSRLGELRQSREKGGKPDVVGLCGCVAEQEGAKLLARSRALSFVLGPGRIGQLASALDAIDGGDRPALTGFDSDRDVDPELVARDGRPRQFVTVIHGCNQHCTFCVVPYTRGHERSRALPEIVEEVRRVAASGAKEITLLGQTVNAYRCPVTGADFGELLEAVCDVPGPWRVQFVTSHPKYFTDSMIEAMAKLPRLGRYLHLPFQAGSDAVLKRMHRGYTRSSYLDLIQKLRSTIPKLTLSTDVIVGFPGETDEDFNQTLEVVEQVGFGQLYGFIYSPRPQTPASRYGARVPRATASERIERLFALQASIQLELNQRLIGQSIEVLADGPAKRGETLWQGRGDDNRVVNFPAWNGLTEGQITRIQITGATAHALLGERDIARVGS